MNTPEGKTKIDPQYINADAARYFQAMVDYGNNKDKGAVLEDYMDERGIRALNQIVSKSTPSAYRSVPTIVEQEGNNRLSYDPYSRLLKERIVLVEGQVDDALASVTIASLLYLGSHASGAAEKPINMYINSPGGSIFSGLAMYDAMRAIPSPIRTIGMGMQASMGSILLAAGDERYMLPNAWLMLHQPLGGGKEQSQHTDMEINATLISQLREDLINVYVRHVGLKHEFWDKIMERDTWIKPEQAKAMGFIHDIVSKTEMENDGSTKKALHEEFAVRSAKERMPHLTVNLPTDFAEIREKINGHDYMQWRAELVVALAQDPTYWTPSLAAEKAKAAAPATALPASIANDDKPAAPKAPGLTG